MAACGVDMAVFGAATFKMSVKMITFNPRKWIMAKLTIITDHPAEVLRRAVEADTSAFYAGADCRAVSGGRLTAEAGDGEVTIRSNRMTEDELREIFAAFLTESKVTK